MANSSGASTASTGPGGSVPAPAGTAKPKGARANRELKDELSYPSWSVKFRDTAAVEFSTDRLTATGYKGWSSVLLTHGASFGCWYFELMFGDGTNIFKKEASVDSTTLRATPPVECFGPLTPARQLHFVGHPSEVLASREIIPHIRVGWSCRYSRYDSPVGCNAFGVALRDVDGSIVTNSVRKPYGYVQLGAGSVVGCGLVLGSSNCSLQDPRLTPALHPFIESGLLCDPSQPPPAIVNPNSSVEFTVNGRALGPAVRDLNNGTYHPAVSLYMGAQCRINLGPDFIYPPPQLSEEAQELTGFSMYHAACRLLKPAF